MEQSTMKRIGFVEELGVLLSEDVHTDVELVCVDGRVYCHAAVLLGTRTWWDSILNHEEDQSVLLVGVSVEEVRRMLQLVYTGVLEGNGLETMKAAIPCLFPGLVNQLEITPNLRKVEEERDDLKPIKGIAHTDTDSTVVETDPSALEEEEHVDNVEMSDGGNCDVTWGTSLEFGMKEEIVEMTEGEGGTKPNQCTVCCKIFKYPKDLKKHELVHKDLTPYSCKLCNRPSKNLSNLYKHLRLSHQRSMNLKQYILDEVGNPLEDAETGHMQENIDPILLDPAYVRSFGSLGVDRQGRDLFSCLVCQKKILQTSLKNHLITHNKSQMKYDCKECGEGFTSHSSLSLHLAAGHRTQPNFICNVCGTPFQELARKVDHQKLCRLNQRNLYTCKHCDKSFHSKHRLLFHRKAEHKAVVKLVSNIHCSACGVYLVGKRKFLKHQIEVHDLPMKCEVCSKHFQSFNKLLIHLEKHKQRAQVKLKKNTRISSSVTLDETNCDSILTESPVGAAYPCDECKTAFSTAQDLKSHQTAGPELCRTHVASFSCDSCSETFKKKAALNKHINTVHRRLRLECQHCRLMKKSTIFSSLSLLRRHLLKHKCVAVMEPSAQPPPPSAPPPPPSAPPSQPSAQPPPPSAQPPQPSAQPPPPSAQLVQPSAQPPQPSAQSSPPSAQPPQPSAQPSQPSAQPLLQSAQPNQPSAQPSPPSAQTPQPSAQPTSPSAQPTPPSAGPSQPLAQHVELRCTVCAVDVDTAAKLADHLVAWTRRRRHECNICSKSFLTQQALTVHGIVHSGEKPHRCDLCGERFTQNTSLKVHILRHQSGSLDPKNLVCRFCGKQCKNLAGYKKHVIQHANTKVDHPVHQEYINPVQYNKETSTVLQDDHVQEQYAKDQHSYYQYNKVDDPVPQYNKEFLVQEEYKADQQLQYNSLMQQRSVAPVEPEDTTEAPVVVDAGLFNLFMDQFQVTTINLESLEQDIGCRTGLLPVPGTLPVGDKQNLFSKEGQYIPQIDDIQYTSENNGVQCTPVSQGIQYNPESLGVQSSLGSQGVQYTSPSRGVQYTQASHRGQYMPVSHEVQNTTASQSVQYTSARQGVQYTSVSQEVSQRVQYTSVSDGVHYTSASLGGVLSTLSNPGVQYTTDTDGRQYTADSDGGQYTFTINEEDLNRVTYQTTRIQEDNALYESIKPGPAYFPSRSQEMTAQEMTVYDVSDQAGAFQEASGDARQQEQEPEKPEDPHYVYKIQVIDDKNFKL